MNIIKIWTSRSGFHIAAFEEREDGQREEIQVRSVHLRGAQGELTSLYKSQGWEPIGRWAAVDENWYRLFRKS